MPVGIARGKTLSISSGRASVATSQSDAARPRTRSRTHPPTIHARLPAARSCSHTLSTSRGTAARSSAGGPCTLLTYHASCGLVPLCLRDDLVHDLARAAADGVEPRVAVQPLDRVLAHEPIASVDLHSLVRHPRAGVGREVFRFGGEIGNRLPAKGAHRDLAREGTRA